MKKTANIYKSNVKTAERILQGINSWEVKKYTDKQLSQLKEAVSGKTNNLLGNNK